MVYIYIILVLSYLAAAFVTYRLYKIVEKLENIHLDDDDFKF